VAAARSAVFIFAARDTRARPRDRERNRRLVSRRFRSTFHQKVDGKGRVSIPATFRRVIELGDPDWKEGLRPNFIIVYGMEYQQRLDCFTLDGMEEIYERIDLMHPGSEEREEMELIYNSYSLDAQIDDDGRIILPQMLRDKLELEPDEKARFMGRNDHFQIWKDATFNAAYAEQNVRMKVGRAPQYDPRIKMPAKPRGVPTES